MQLTPGGPLLALLLFACTADPREDPVFVPAVGLPVGQLELRAPASLSVDRPLSLELFADPGADANLRIDLSAAGPFGQPDLDVWTLRPAEGVEYVSPYWRDLRAQFHIDRRLVRAGSPEAGPLHLGDVARVSRPGRYAVQLQTLRAGELWVSPPTLIEVGPASAASASGGSVEALVAAARSAQDPEEAAAAFRALIASGAPEALPLAVDALMEPDADPWWATIVHTHPDAAAARRLLGERIDAPEVPVSATWIELWAALLYNERFAEPAAPLLDPDDVAAAQRVRLDRQLRGHVLAEVRAAAAARVAAALDAKRGEALGVTLGALVSAAMRDEDSPWFVSWLQHTRAALDALPDDALQPLLRDWWEAVADPAVADALTRLATRVDPVGDLALRRLGELDPAIARPVLIARLRQPQPAASESGEWALRQLTDPPPDAVDALLTSLQASPDDVRLARLAAFFAQTPHAARIHAAFEAGTIRNDDALTGAYIAALLNAGDPRGRQLLALVGPDRPALLEHVAAEAHDPEALVPRALEALESGSIREATSAARVLASYAPPTLRPRLFELLVEADGVEELPRLTALISGRRWFLTDAERSEIHRSLSYPQAMARLNRVQTLGTGILRLDGHVVDGVPVLLLNDQEYAGPQAIQQKLMQLPEGTPVKLTYRGASVQQGAALFEPIVHGAGLKLFVPDTGG